MSQSTQLAKHKSRAIQRRVEREIELMRAKAEVGMAIADHGTELHERANDKILEAAQYSQLLAQAAANLNGASEETIQNLLRIQRSHADHMYEYVQQVMASLLEQGGRMPVSPEVGFTAQLGDALAELQDEWDRQR